MYTELLLKNQLQFENKIVNDDFLLRCIKNIIMEDQEKREGYELALRGLCYQILTTLLRHHTKIVSNQSELRYAVLDGLNRFSQPLLIWNLI